LRIKKEIHDSFQYSIARARALLALQEGINLLLELQESEDIFAAIIKRFDGTVPFFDIVKENIIEPMKQKMVEVTKDFQEDRGYKTKVEESASKLDVKGIEKAFKPLIEIIQSVSMVYEDPLYHEAIVSSVTAFETYLKDTIVYLVSNSKRVEARFTKTLNKKLSYEKIKYYGYEWDRLMGYIVADNIEFYKLNEVERAYREALGKKKSGRFKILSNDSQQKKLQNFIRLRHLIVHNGGFVDHKFRKETNCQYKVGDPYPLTKKYVESMIGTMIKVVDKIEEEIKKA